MATRARRRSGEWAALHARAPLLITLLVSPAELVVDELWVDGGRYRHLFRARRLAVGDRLRLVDGGGRARRADVERLERGRALLRLSTAEAVAGPRRRVELLVAPPRPPRADLAGREGHRAGRRGDSLRRRRTGARAATERATLTRLRRVAEAALEQSQQARLPELSGVHDWRELESLLAGGGERLRLERGGAAWRPGAGGGSLAIVIGPEGGWTTAETAALEGLGCRATTLGPTVLRVETAAVAAAALALAGGGETPCNRCVDTSDGHRYPRTRGRPERLRPAPDSRR